MLTKTFFTPLRLRQGASLVLRRHCGSRGAKFNKKEKDNWFHAKTMLRGSVGLTCGYSIPVSMLYGYNYIDTIPSQQTMWKYSMFRQMKGYSFILTASVVIYTATYSLISCWTLSGFIFSTVWNLNSLCMHMIGQYFPEKMDTITQKIT